MSCKYCKGNCQKAGKQKNGSQRLYCVVCRKYQQTVYRRVAYQPEITGLVGDLLCEGVGVRGISRVLGIAVGTVISRIRRLGQKVCKPSGLSSGRAFEVDELWTYVGKKSNEYWVAYALERQTKQVVDFIVGKRTKATLKVLIESLEYSPENNPDR